MYFLFDIGGTNIRLALINPKKMEIKVDKVLKVPTPKLYSDGIELISKYLEENNVVGQIEATVGGTTGVLNIEKNELINARKLPDWNFKPLKKDLEEITGSKVLLENDSALAALGEATYGVGKFSPIVSYLTISTGVGGSRIVNRKIERSAFNFEPGNQVLLIGDEVHYLEDLISGQGIEKRYGKKPEEISDPNVWQEVEYHLALALNNLLVHWSPNIIVIGGAVGRNLNLENVENNLKKIMRIYPETPQIKKSTLRHNGIHGALYLLRDSALF